MFPFIGIVYSICLYFILLPFPIQLSLSVPPLKYCLPRVLMDNMKNILPIPKVYWLIPHTFIAFLHCTGYCAEMLRRQKYRYNDGFKGSKGGGIYHISPQTTSNSPSNKKLVGFLCFSRGCTVK